MSRQYVMLPSGSSRNKIEYLADYLDALLLKNPDSITPPADVGDGGSSSNTGGNSGSSDSGSDDSGSDDSGTGSDGSGSGDGSGDDIIPPWYAIPDYDSLGISASDVAQISDDDGWPTLDISTLEKPADSSAKYFNYYPEFSQPHVNDVNIPDVSFHIRDTWTRNLGLVEGNLIDTVTFTGTIADYKANYTPKDSNDDIANDYITGYVLVKFVNGKAQVVDAGAVGFQAPSY